MNDTVIIIFFTLVAIGFSSVGYLWGYKAGERKWLKFIEENFDRRSEAAIKRDNLKNGE